MKLEVLGPQGGSGRKFPRAHADMITSTSSSDIHNPKATSVTVGELKNPWARRIWADFWFSRAGSGSNPPDCLVRGKENNIKPELFRHGRPRFLPRNLCNFCWIHNSCHREEEAELHANFRNSGISGFWVGRPKVGRWGVSNLLGTPQGS